MTHLERKAIKEERRLKKIEDRKTGKAWNEMLRRATAKDALIPDPAELDRLLSVEPEDMNPVTSKL